MPLVAEFLHTGASIPIILLTEDAYEETVAQIIESGTWNRVAESQLDGATLVRTIRNTLALHPLQREPQSSQELLQSCLVQLSNLRARY